MNQIMEDPVLTKDEIIDRLLNISILLAEECKDCHDLIEELRKAVVEELQRGDQYRRRAVALHHKLKQARKIK